MVVGILASLDNVTTMDFKQSGDLIILLGDTFNELGGSEYYHFIHHLEGGIVPQTDPPREKRVLECVLEAISRKFVTACHDCSKGGLAIALAKMCMKGNLGAQIDLKPVESQELQIDELLFAESHSRFILSIKKDLLNTLKELAEQYSVPFYLLGKVTKEPSFAISYSTGRIKCDVIKMKKIWIETIPKIMKG
jgi:phosphoribosylformylglycinamidine synthase